MGIKSWTVVHVDLFLGFVLFILHVLMSLLALNTIPSSILQSKYNFVVSVTNNEFVNYCIFPVKNTFDFLEQKMIVAQIEWLKLLIYKEI